MCLYVSFFLFIIRLFYQIFYDTFATYSYKQTNNICYHEFTDMYSHSHPYRHYFYYAMDIQ